MNLAQSGKIEKNSCEINLENFTSKKLISSTILHFKLVTKLKRKFCKEINLENLHL
jgi:hypothetical protein